MSCLANDVLIVSPGGRRVPREVHSLTLANGPIPIRDDLNLDLGLLYDIIKTNEPGKGPYKVRTRAYDYAIRDGTTRALVSYHWHPMGESRYKAPHFHVPPQWEGIHFPCERTSLESVVRLCIQELGASPNRDDWDNVLTLNEASFKLWRSWSTDPEVAKATD